VEHLHDGIALERRLLAAIHRAVATRSDLLAKNELA
jgi:hypothetical protein